MNKRRFKELNNNLQSAGVTCAHTLNGDFLNVIIPFDEIDFILLDPSCSGSGIRNRNDDTEIINEKRLERLASLQIRMVTYALTNFPKVKRVTYSTCSIHSQENEQVVETILDQFSDTFQVRKSVGFRNEL
jgi:putative methyltransferase